MSKSQALSQALGLTDKDIIIDAARAQVGSETPDIFLGGGVLRRTPADVTSFADHGEAYWDDQDESSKRILPRWAR